MHIAQNETNNADREKNSNNILHVKKRKLSKKNTTLS
jgi:hypothetical protein